MPRVGRSQRRAAEARRALTFSSAGRVSGRRGRPDRFVFETPYTADGQSQGSVESQRKRLTLLTTELPFPYMKRRLLVVKHEEVCGVRVRVTAPRLRGPEGMLTHRARTHAAGRPRRRSRRARAAGRHVTHRGGAWGPAPPMRGDGPGHLQPPDGCGAARGAPKQALAAAGPHDPSSTRPHASACEAETAVGRRRART